MSNMTTVEAKAFVPARDFALSKQFYQDWASLLTQPIAARFAPELSWPSSPRNSPGRQGINSVEVPP